MTDQGEKTCPLCAEEMDLTDQQLKPCMCGYEICIWCWHHIMDMAEKDDSEGRCPACRTPYDKEKIVGMASKCERMVTGINMEKKFKTQKHKNKTSEGRKQLSSVRVIRRNLVYVVGLPINLADEDILQRKECFGQYGKVVKVSISRTAAGSIQHFPNNTCSVYITYSKEDEAIRCIETVHGFTLDGKTLRACFGTTKYCHAWLRSVPCNNQDCLYLHEIGSQDDSFTKDEIISEYTRSRVQQVTGVGTYLQRSSGNMLPPPLDEYSNNGSTSATKPIVKNASNNQTTIVRDSPLNISAGRSVALPLAASWGTRSSNFHPPNSACSNEPSKKPDMENGSMPCSSVAANTIHIPKAHGDMGNKLKEGGRTVQIICKPDILEAVKSRNMDCEVSASNLSVTSSRAPGHVCISGQLSCALGTVISNYSLAPDSKSFNHDQKSWFQGEGSVDDSANGKIQNLCSIMSSMSIDMQHRSEDPNSIKLNFRFPDNVLINSYGPENLESQQHYAELEKFSEPLISSEDRKRMTSSSGVAVISARELRFDSQSHLIQNECSEVQEAFPSFHDQRFSDSDISTTSLHNSSSIVNFPREPSSQLSEPYGYGTSALISDTNLHEGLLISNRYPENSAGLNKTVGNSHLLLNNGKVEQFGRLDSEQVRDSTSKDMRESNIISNILSLDFDAWDDSLTSPQNMAQFLCEGDKQHVSSLKKSNSSKLQNCNQSRFSFARQEESMNNVFDIPLSYNEIEVPRNHQSLRRNLVENGDFSAYRNVNGFRPSYVEDSNNFMNSRSILSSSKLPGSRAQVSAPPGFALPSRTPPPGFLYHERMDQYFDVPTENQLDNASFHLRSPYHNPESVNMISTEDIEFIDPAILAVGKGRFPSGHKSQALDMRPNLSQQFSTFENDTRLQLLMQRSLSTQHNIGYTNTGDNFFPRNDSFTIPSRIMDSSQQINGNISQFSQQQYNQSRNGHLGWSDVHNGNSLGMNELLRNERLSGFNRFYNTSGYEDSKFRMANSADVYNRTFGM